MNLGFNSKIQVGDGLYHVQTEDRGSTHPFIDTVVLHQGQVLHRRSTSYQDLLVVGTADQAALYARVEQQHRDVLEGLRAGSLPIHEVPPAASHPALEIRLRNSTAWLSSGQATLEIEVCDRAKAQPLSGVEMKVTVENATPESACFAARTDAAGLAVIRFPMPHLAHPEAAVLVIGARLGPVREQIRYHLKPRTHDSGPHSR